MGKMVLSAKRKRKDAIFDTSPDIPKRSKVHAQRKFAQGAFGPSMVSPSAPLLLREESSQKPSPPISELLPNRRPNTEDFLTFLCFRGTPTLPPNLDFFNNAPGVSLSVTTGSPPDMPRLATPSTTPATVPFIPFGVRKRALVYPENSPKKLKDMSEATGAVYRKNLNRSEDLRKAKQISMEKTRQHRVAVHALRRKYQEQTMAKLRAVAFSKISGHGHTVTTRSRGSIGAPQPSQTVIRKQARIAPVSKCTPTSVPTLHKSVGIRTKVKPKTVPVSVTNATKRGMLLRSSANVMTARVIKPSIRKPLHKTVLRPKVTNMKKRQKNEKVEIVVNKAKTDTGFELLECKVAVPLIVKPVKTRGNADTETTTHKKTETIMRDDKKTIRTEPLLKRTINKDRSGNMSSDYSSDDDKPLVKTVKKAEGDLLKKVDSPNISKIASKIITKSAVKIVEKLLEKKLNESAKDVPKAKIVDKELILDNEIIIVNKTETVLQLQTDTTSIPKLKEKLADKLKVNQKIVIPVIEKPGSRSVTPKINLVKDNTVKKVISVAKQQHAPLKCEKGEMQENSRLKETVKESLKKAPVLKAVIPVPTLEEKRVSRPSRKTKEAAAIYMEMLGRKLNSAEDAIDDDDFSIDSFPELPNVRNTERRELELKAKASKAAKVQKCMNKHLQASTDAEEKVKSDVADVKCQKTDVSPLKNVKKFVAKDSAVKPGEYGSNSETPSEPDSDLSLFESNKIVIDKTTSKRNLRSDKRNVPELENVEIVDNTEPTLDKSFNDSDEEPLASKIPMKPSTEEPPVLILQKAIQDEIPVVRKEARDEKPVNKTTSVLREDGTVFSKESSEEVLMKVFGIKEKLRHIPASIASNTIIPSVEESHKIFGIAKRINFDTPLNIKKVANNDKDKKCELKTSNKVDMLRSPPKLELIKPLKRTGIGLKTDSDVSNMVQAGLMDNNCVLGKCSPLQNPPVEQSVERKQSSYMHEAGLTSKDLSSKRRVNMSSEQIEKWLNESCFEPELVEPVDDFLMLDEVHAETPNDTADIEPVKNFESKSESKNKTVETTVKKSPDSAIKNNRKPIFNQRRNPIHKHIKTSPVKVSPKPKPPPSKPVFSPGNEFSVYDFSIDDNPTPFSTPFRKNQTTESLPSLSSKKNIRKRSTGTEMSKVDLETKTEVELLDDQKQIVDRWITTDVKNNLKPLQFSLIQEDPQSKSSIAVQCNFEPKVQDQITADARNIEISTQTEEQLDQEGHLFYIPLQKSRSGDQASEQMIQGVAVKLGTEGPDGPNQRVIMRAKLVTKAQITNQMGETAVNMDEQLMKNILGGKLCADFKNKRLTNTSVPVGTVQPLSRSKDDDSNVKIPPKFKSYLKHTAEKRLSDSSSDLQVVKSVTLPINTRKYDQIIEAPTFHPTEKEFQDPIAFIEQISPIAAQYGLCRIVPPSSFKPECKVSDDMRFTAYNQYVNRMMYRFGPSVKEMLAIKKYLATQSIMLAHAPWIGGMEIDLPRLYHTVQELGGLKEVIEKKKWHKVAEEMCIPKSAQDRVAKLDDIYCKYLLPYDTLSTAERDNLLREVEVDWARREALYRQKQQEKYNSDQSADVPVVSNPKSSRSNDNASEKDSESESEGDSESERDLRECTVKGRNMALNAFYRIARNTMAMWFKNTQPDAEEVEEQYWQHVSRRDRHVCVHVGSIDSSGCGYGFPSAKAKNSPFSKHPWNLKVLTNNSGSMLRSLGPVMGLTVPTLHVGMVFSACCWYRDPHGLPWVEYLHTGANKIWYGIPNNSSLAFREALSELAPQSVLPQTIWLPSDSAMVPPDELLARGLPLSRTVQRPGEFIIVCPKAYTSSLCTGYTVSESVYYGTRDWLDCAQKDFKECLDSREPTMFSLEQLLLSIAADPRSQEAALRSILTPLQSLVEQERSDRARLREYGVAHKLERGERSGTKPLIRNVKGLEGAQECDVCRANLFVSMVTDAEDDITLCLRHALLQLSDKPLDKQKVLAARLRLTYSHSLQELQAMADRVTERLTEKVTVKKNKR